MAEHPVERVICGDKKVNKTRNMLQSGVPYASDMMQWEDRYILGVWRKVFVTLRAANARN